MLIAERRSPLYGRLTYHWFVPWQRAYASTTVRGFYELALGRAQRYTELVRNTPGSTATGETQGRP